MFHVSFQVSYSIVGCLYVSCSGRLPRLEKRALIFLLSFTCNFVVSVSGVSLPLGVIGGVILLWHSLGLPYNHFT